MVGQGKQTSAERRKERAAAARAEATAQTRKRRLQVLAGGLAVAVVAGVVGGGIALLSGDDDAVDTASTAPSPEPEPTADQSGVAEGKKRCLYLDNPGDTGGKDAGRPPEIADATSTYYATIVTSQGTIQASLNTAAAPCAVNSFVHLAGKGFYNATPCHRMLDSSQGGFTNAVLQCGDPTGTGSGGPGYKFPDENLTGAKYPKGVIAMANAGKNTNGSQFFMMFKDSSFSPDYVPFGMILSGVEVLEKIAEGGRTINPTTGADDVPKTKVTIEKVTVSTTKPKS